MTVLPSHFPAGDWPIINQPSPMWSTPAIIYRLKMNGIEVESPTEDGAISLMEKALKLAGPIHKTELD